MRAGARRRRKLHKRQNLAMRIAGVLLLLVCVSTWMLCGMLARYTAQGTGKDSARVAGFKVEAAGTPEDQTVSASERDTVTADYKITIENKSEVAVRYSVYVTFEKVLPEWIHVNLTDAREADTTSPDGRTFYFNNLADLAMGGTGEELMTITLDGEKFALSAQEENGSYAMSYEEDLKFEVYINAVQID